MKIRKIIAEPELTSLPPAIDTALRTLAAAGERIDSKDVSTFQNLMADTKTSLGSVGAALRDLAYDLEYFVADPSARAQDASYFGPEKASAMVADASRKVEELLARHRSRAQSKQSEADNGAV
jgi:hypothetical protein